MVSGRSRTGKTNFLKVLMKAVSRKEADVCIIEFDRQELKRAAEQIGAEYLSDPKQVYQYFLGTVSAFRERNQKKRAYMEMGMDEEELCRKVEEERPVFLFIADLEQFIQAAYTPLEKVGAMNAYPENITEKGSFHGFYFFACMNTETIASVYGRKLYNNMVSYKTGIHLGGNTAQQKLFSFTNIPFVEQNKAMKTGIGLYPSAEDSGVAKRLIIPAAKGESFDSDCLEQRKSQGNSNAQRAVWGAGCVSDG